MTKAGAWVPEMVALLESAAANGRPWSTATDLERDAEGRLNVGQITWRLDELTYRKVVDRGLTVVETKAGLLTVKCWRLKGKGTSTAQRLNQ